MQKLDPPVITWDQLQGCLFALLDLYIPWKSLPPFKKNGGSLDDDNKPILKFMVVRKPTGLQNGESGLPGYIHRWYHLFGMFYGSIQALSLSSRSQLWWFSHPFSETLKLAKLSYFTNLDFLFEIKSPISLTFHRQLGWNNSWFRGRFFHLKAPPRHSWSLTCYLVLPHHCRGGHWLSHAPRNPPGFHKQKKPRPLKGCGVASDW